MDRGVRIDRRRGRGPSADVEAPTERFILRRLRAAVKVLQVAVGTVLSRRGPIPACVTQTRRADDRPVCLSELSRNYGADDPLERVTC